MQLGSDAIFSQTGTPLSLPAHLRADLGVRIYAAIARIAPAPYAFAMLARAQLDRGDLAQAQRYAAALSPSARRSDLLGRIASRRGDHALAQRYFIAADDVFAIRAEVKALTASDPAAAYRVEQMFVRRLERTATHPDALADAYWRLGDLASKLAHPRLAMAHFRSAVALSPLSAKYLMAAGFQAYDLREDAAARSYFQRAIAVDPGNADAYAGAGMEALRFGDRSAALRYAARSREYGPHSHPLRTLESLLQ